MFAPITIATGGSQEIKNATRNGDGDDKAKRELKETRTTRRNFVAEVAYRHAKREAAGEGRRLTKRDSPGRTFASSPVIDSWYGCDVWDEMIDYALNFTFPWCECPLRCESALLALTLLLSRSRVRRRCSSY